MDAACRAICFDCLDLSDILEMAADGALNETHVCSCVADSNRIDNNEHLIVLATRQTERDVSEIDYNTFDLLR